MNQPSLAQAAHNSAKLTYIPYLLGTVTGGVTAIIGVFVAYRYRDESPPWLFSHYRYLIRTFWLSLAYIAIGLILTPVLIGVVLLLLEFVWFVARCIKGWQALDAELPVSNEESWVL